MARTIRDLRDGIAEAIRSTLEADGWTESRFVADSFRDAHAAHKCFAVSTPSSTPIPRDHQRRAEGAVVETTIVVRWAWRIAVDGQVEGYGAALDAEAAVLEAALEATDLRPTLLSVQRQVTRNGEAVIGTIQMSITHTWAIVG